MQKVTNISEARKHVYHLDYCSGCNEVLDEYYEIVLDHDTHKEHIGLCESCNQLAELAGV